MLDICTFNNKKPQKNAIGAVVTVVAKGLRLFPPPALGKTTGLCFSKWLNEQSIKIIDQRLVQDMCTFCGSCTKFDYTLKINKKTISTQVNSCLIRECH